MAPEKACKKCKALFTTGNKCPECGHDEFASAHKGRVAIFNPEQSEMAKSLKIAKKGNYALRLG